MEEQTNVVQPTHPKVGGDECAAGRVCRWLGSGIIKQPPPEMRVAEHRGPAKLHRKALQLPCLPGFRLILLSTWREGRFLSPRLMTIDDLF
jgi:hypothetical protein